MKNNELKKFKKTMYQKTKRFSDKVEVTITEKIDGSNLSIFTDGENNLYVATRNYIYDVTENCDELGKTLKGIVGFIDKNRDYFIKNLSPNSAIIGEWVGQGYIKYKNRFNDGRFLQFAKAPIIWDNGIPSFDKDKTLYHQDLFKYNWKNKEVPEFIKFVPIVLKTNMIQTPTLVQLEELYKEYAPKVMEEHDVLVEGFVIYVETKMSFNDKPQQIVATDVKKFIKYKNGKTVVNNGFK